MRLAVAALALSLVQASPARADREPATVHAWAKALGRFRWLAYSGRCSPVRVSVSARCPGDRVWYLSDDVDDAGPNAQAPLLRTVRRSRRDARVCIVAREAAFEPGQYLVWTETTVEVTNQVANVNAELTRTRARCTEVASGYGVD